MFHVFTLIPGLYSRLELARQADTFDQKFRRGRNVNVIDGFVVGKIHEGVE